MEFDLVLQLTLTFAAIAVFATLHDASNWMRTAEYVLKKVCFAYVYL